MSLWAVLLSGLVAGGVSCAAVQGGLLAGIVARRPSAPKSARELVGAGRPAGGVSLTTGSGRTGFVDVAITNPAAGWGRDAAPVMFFLAGKLTSHVLVGAALGALGASFQFGVRARGLLQVVAGLVLLLFALDLLGVRSARRFMPAAPASWARLARRSARLDSALAPGLLGLATVLVPCGVTLSMEFLAVASGSPLRGAATMGTFVVGTIPLFAAIGVLARRSGRASGALWQRATGVVVLISGILSLNAGLVLLDSRWAPRRVYERVTSSDALPKSGGSPGATSVNGAGATTTPAAVTDGVTVGTDGVQRVTISAKSSGYSPSKVRLRAGLPTKLMFHSAGFG